MLIAKTFHDIFSKLDPNGRPMRVFVISPSLPEYPHAKFPGVVVFSEIYQVTGPVERFAGQIASQGYVVACPSTYHEFEGPEAIPYDTEGTDRGNQYKIEKELAAYDEDATLSIDLLLSLPNCNGRIAATGMCLGGHLAFRAAFDPRILASVCFFATDIHTATLGKHQSDDTLARVMKGDIKGEVVMIFGKQDTHVPRGGRDLIRKTLEDANTKCSFLEVQAQHAFIRDEHSKGRWDAALTRSLFSFMMEVFERSVARDLGPRAEDIKPPEHSIHFRKPSSSRAINGFGDSSYIRYIAVLLRGDILANSSSIAEIVECENLNQFSIYDYLHRVPGYSDTWRETKEHIQSAVSVSHDPINVVVDSVDCLLSDNKTISETCQFLYGLLHLISTSTQSCHLILHVSSPEIVPLLLQPSFSPAVSHITAHPPILLREIATSLSTPLPTDNNDVKFWNVFLAITERQFELDHLVFGQKGDGEGDPKEIVVQLMSRPGSGRKGVERTLQGWKVPDGTSCSLSHLSSLNALYKTYTPSSVNPAQNLSFNLTLTESQQESKATVPLPYVHDGNPMSSTILYDPDSADDIDDDDPDEDLDI